jgi:hypothetical protein
MEKAALVLAVAVALGVVCEISARSPRSDRA